MIPRVLSPAQPSPAQPSPAHTAAHTTTRRRGSALEFALSLLFTYVGRFFPRFSSNSWTRASLMANSWMDFCLFTESFHSRPGSGRSLATGALWRAGGWARGHDSARMWCWCSDDSRDVTLAMLAGGVWRLLLRAEDWSHVIRLLPPAPPRPATKYRTVVHCTVQTLYTVQYTPAICVVVTRRYPPQLDSGTHNTAHLALSSHLFYFSETEKA